MSADAIGWVYRHSPYSGSTFQVHHAIADSVNDQHENEFWMRLGRLAEKARISRETATKAVGVLVEDGYLLPLDTVDEARREERGRRYAFLYPAVDVVFETRRNPRDQSRSPCDDSPQGHAAPDHNREEPKIGTQLEPKVPKSIMKSPHLNDARALCELLADHVESLGEGRPEIKNTWLVDMERLIRLDHKAPERVARAITWVHGDGFWSAIIQSPSGLRRNYGKIAAQARRGGVKTRNVAAELGLDQEPFDDDVIDVRSTG